MLPALGAILTPIMLLVVLGPLAMYVEAHIWRNIPEAVSGAAGEWIRPAVLLLLAATAVAVPASIAAGVLFFARRTSAPLMFVALLWYSSTIVDLAAFGFFFSGLDTETSLETLYSDTILGLAVNGILTAYMLTSKRVRVTFVRRRGRRSEATVPSTAIAVSGAQSPVGSM